MSGPRVVPDAPMSEMEWARKVRDLAETCGWRCCHVAPSMTRRGKWTTATSVVGWPDLALYRPGDFLFAELKTDVGKLSAEQETVIADLRAAGVEVCVWKPKHWSSVVDRLVRV